MEQVGTSGLPPLLPSVPVPVPVADSEQSVDQVVEQDLCSLTELVPVRSKQHTSASDRILAVEEEELVDDPLEEQLEEEMQEDPSPSVQKIGQTLMEIVVSKFDTSELSQEDPHPDNEEDLNPDVPLELPSETSDTNSEVRPDTPSDGRSQSSTPTFQVPPHLLGRTVENPQSDIPPGRRTQKPRLGVRVPYRNLTSQIVTQNEIAQEIFERTQKKHPEMVQGMVPKGGIANSDLFTRKLTQRLASSITAPTAKPKTAIVPESIGTLKALLPNHPKQPGAAAAAIVDGVRLSPGFTYNEKDKAMDDAELLSILEGDGDPLWLPDKLLRKPESSQTGSSPTPPATNAMPVLTPPPPPKLDPEVEKTLALKQLMELPTAFPPKKPEKKAESKRSRRRSGKAKQDGGENEEGVVVPLATPETGSVNQLAVEENGGNAENAPPVTTPAPPAKKAVSSRKRKMTPEVAAVLKKPRVSKKAEAAAKNETNAKVDPKAEVLGKLDAAESVANGKAKGGKSATPTPPVESNKKKVGGNKKATPLSKTEPEPVVTNGNTETTIKKKSVKKAGKRKPGDTTPKKPAVKTTPTKTVKSPKVANKMSSATANKSQVPPQSPKPQKSTELITEAEEVSEPPKDLSMEVVEEEPAPILEPPQEPVEKEKEPQSQTPQKKATRINRELEHLLGDEGAVNMLYAVEGHKRKGSKDLALKARLVKTAVMRLSSSPQGHMPLALRARRSLNVTEPPKLVKMSGSRKQRHHSSESLDSMRSPPYLTPVENVSSQVFPQRQKLTADDSRIIRRHSTSSSYSSPDVSPRRASVEDGSAQNAPGTSGSPRKKGVPIFVRDKARNLTYDGMKKPKVVNPVAFDSVLLKEQLLELSKKPNLLPNPAAIKTKDLRKLSEVNGRVKTELLKKMKKGLDSSSAIAKKVIKLQRAQLLAERKAAEEIAKAQKVAEELRQVQKEVDDLAVEDELPITPVVIKQEGKKNSAPQSPDAASEACKCTYGACLASCARCVTGPLFCVSPTGYSNLLKSLHPKGKKSHEERQRATARHCAGTYNYKEITVRRYDNVVHVILAPVSTKMSSSLNIQVLRELRDALQQVRKDDQCKVVLLTSSGSIFCQGIDVSGLIQSNNEKRKTAAFEMSLALKDFLKCIAHFPKPVVAGVQGAAVGLGVTMLPLFDMVFASDKATFHTPYAQMGQVPDGGATLTLPYMLGHTATSELLLNCRKLTANEALKCGLVTRVLWPDRFMEELIPIVKSIAQQSAQSMEATKALLRHGLRTKFDAALESETHLLVEHWTSKECQLSFQGMVESGAVTLQRQRATDA